MPKDVDLNNPECYMSPMRGVGEHLLARLAPDRCSVNHCEYSMIGTLVTSARATAAHITSMYFNLGVCRCGRM